MNTPSIPFGYKPVLGQSVKGDGIWNGTEFVPVRRGYPNTEPAIIIRKCIVEQTEIPATVQIDASECEVWEE